MKNIFLSLICITLLSSLSACKYFESKEDSSKHVVKEVVKEETVKEVVD